MPYTIEYGGDATIALDVVLEALASEHIWLVEVHMFTTGDPIVHTGNVTGYEETEHGVFVTISPTIAPDHIKVDPNVEAIVIRTEDIHKLVIP